MISPAKLKQKLQGVVVVMTTPFNDDLSVDYEGLRGTISFCT